MANSKFLKWQDKNGDGLIDVCDDQISVVPVSKCPFCKVDPNYIAPNWRERTVDEPWLNLKVIKYQITVPTTVDSIIPPTGTSAEEYIEQIFKEHEEEAIDSLLVAFAKLDSPDIRQIIRDVIEYQKYDLDPRPHSKLKLLYSVPCDDFYVLPPEEPDEEEDEEEAGDIIVKI